MKVSKMRLLPVLCFCTLTGCNMDESNPQDSTVQPVLDPDQIPVGTILSPDQIREMGGVPQAFETAKTGKKEIVLPTGEKLTVDYVVKDGYKIWGGDMIVGLENEPIAKGAANLGSGGRWPGGIIPYEFVTTNSAKIAATKAAMNYWMANTSIRFVAKHNGHSNWVRIKDGSENSSYVGMITGPQDLLLNDAAESVSRHEIGHLVGLVHEHQRQDRDAHVQIVGQMDVCRPDLTGAITYSQGTWGTTYEALVFKEDICPKIGISSGPYDRNSLMHYQNFPDNVNFKAKRFCLTYSNDPNYCKVVDLNFKAISGTLSGAGIALSSYDIAAVNSMYPHGSPNLDGLADLHFFEPGNSSVYLASSTGSGFSGYPYVWASGIPGDRKDRILTGDFDGDGASDIGYLKSNGAIAVFRSVGNSYASPVDWIQPGHFGHDNGRHYAGDFDGDGRTDLVFFEPGTQALVFARSTGSYFQPVGNWVASSAFTLTNNFHPADFNGDGLCDIGYFGADKSFRVARSTGNSFATPATWLSSGYFGNLTVYPFVGDFTGEGRDDLLVFVATSNTISMIPSTGTSFGPSQQWVGSNGFGSVPANYLVGDFNGDRKADLAYFEPYGSGTMYVNRTNSSGTGFMGGTGWISGWGHTNGKFFIGQNKKNRTSI